MATLLWGVASFAQAPEATAKWSVASKPLSGDEYELGFSAAIADGWHIYTLTHQYNPITIEFGEEKGWSLAGKPEEITKPSNYKDELVFFNSAKIIQKVKLLSDSAEITGTVHWSGCNDSFCSSPEEWDFSVTLKKQGQETSLNASSEKDSGVVSTVPDLAQDTIHSTSIQDPEGVTEESQKAGGSLWGLIIEAILWGFAMLLTPCVFPMVPMTISFFMKQSSSPAAGRFKAFMYGLFIVLLYTVPISVIIALTWFIGGNAVTADIFNWLATHWLPNLIFFIVFMAFAASFFGAFEIELPTSLVNNSDRKSEKKGLAGVFFMALTLVLVSFSCTGPIVGTVLIKSTQGEFWTPMVTMLAFSVAFALPFTILALFPSLLKKLKSGSWLNSVKVVLGFIEVALGFKFLSVADQTYHWGILDREVYLAIWIVVFTLLGLYLLGKIRFKNDSPVEHLSVLRLSLAIAVFSFVVYMIPGMWGAPLKALSGYLPPLETQDFVLSGNTGENVPPASEVSAGIVPSNVLTANKYGLKMPLGLNGCFTIEDGLKASKASGKPVFVDITGHGCVNCREMEQRVWSDPQVMNILKNDYVIVALFTDDKTKLEESDWISTDSGKTLKELGRANSWIVRSRFGVNAQPNYALLDSDGNQMVPIRGYNLSVDGFVEFLNSGLEKFRAGEQNL